VLVPVFTSSNTCRNPFPPLPRRAEQVAVGVGDRLMLVSAFGLIGFTRKPIKAGLWDIFVQHLEWFGHDHAAQEGYPCDIATRPVQALDKAQFERISSEGENDPNSAACCFSCKRSGSCTGRNHGHPATNQVGGQAWKSLIFRFCPTVIAPYCWVPSVFPRATLTLIEEHLRVRPTPFFTAFSVLSNDDSQAHACAPIPVLACHAKP
jgi:hypothetical protein